MRKKLQTPTWIVPVSSVALILGFLLVSATKTSVPESRPSRFRIYGGGENFAPVLGDRIQQQEAEIAKLREQITQLQNALAEEDRRSKVLNDSLQEAKLLAGLVAVEGPGIEIVLRDSKKPAEGVLTESETVIHDVDVQTCVNELWLSGAEAVAVNNQRITSNTSYFCQGPVIYVGGVGVSSPITIRAIGDPDTLYGALTMRGRFLYELRSVDPHMVEVRKKEHIVLPAYTGSTRFKFAKAVKARE